MAKRRPFDARYAGTCVICTKYNRSGRIRVGDSIVRSGEKYAHTKCADDENNLPNGALLTKGPWKARKVEW